MKKLLLLLVCIISVHSISLGQVEKQIKGEALSADEKKKLEDSLQGWKFGGLGNMTLSQAAFVVEYRVWYSILKRKWKIQT